MTAVEAVTAGSVEVVGGTVEVVDDGADEVVVPSSVVDGGWIVDGGTVVEVDEVHVPVPQSTRGRWRSTR